MNLTWTDLIEATRDLADRHRATADTYTGIYGIPRGGVPVALLTAPLLGLPLLDEPQPGALIVDDLADSGRTATRYHNTETVFDALYRKPGTPTTIAPAATLTDAWLVFPWEHDNGSDIEDAVTRLIQYIGEDPNRDGLTDTPHRVAKTYRELTTGYHTDPASILNRTFDVGPIDQMIHVDNIEFVSLCEHHMLPFTGVAHVAYIPNGRVVGLSKIPRTVETYARRLQVQERLTEQIADAIQHALNPEGVGVTITAHHSCMSLRGAKQPNATMTTTALRGLIKTNPATQAEYTAHTHTHHRFMS